MSESKKSGEPGWSWRKAIIFPNVIVSFWLVYLLIGAQDTRVNETISWGLILNIIASVFFYTGFATAQDIMAIFATKNGRPYGDQPPPPVASDPYGEPTPPPGVR